MPPAHLLEQLGLERRLLVVVEPEEEDGDGRDGQQRREHADGLLGQRAGRVGEQRAWR